MQRNGTRVTHGKEHVSQACPRTWVAYFAARRTGDEAQERAAWERKEEAERVWVEWINGAKE